jgi:PAS domain S-box-containing protein
MDAVRESPVEEVTRLRAGLKNLIDITALPLLPSTSDEPEQIAGTLLNALLETLQLAFVCVRLTDPEGGPCVEVVRVAASLAQTAGVRGIAETIRGLLTDAPARLPPRARVCIGDADLSLAAALLGLQGELGVLVAGSLKPDFPADMERLLLDAAANRAAIGLQHALLRQQKRLASDLSEAAARRTSELEAATVLLKEEVAEHRRTEQALRANELNFQLTVDTIPGMVHTMTATGQVEFVSRQVLDFFGKTLEALNDWEPLVHPDDRSQVVERWTRSIATGEPFDSEHRVLRADGTYRWLRARGLPLRDTSGNIVRWYNLLTDADERVRAEEALRESERESRLLLDNIPGLVSLLTEIGEVAVVNRELLSYFGQTLEELRQWGTNGTVHPEDVPHVAEVFTRSIASGSPYKIVQRFRRRDGVYRWFENSGFPLRNTTGSITGWCVLLTDIDERKRAEDALKHSERNLKLIIDTVPALAWSARVDGSAEFFSQHYLDYVGVAAEAMCDWGWTVAVHPDDLSGLGAAWLRIMASEAPGETEARLRSHDGTYRWFLFRTNPLRDESGAITKWYGVNTDIEDRKRAEVELRQAYDSFADAQRLSKTGSFITDLVGDDHNWSEETYRIFEFEAGTSVTVQRIRDIIHPDDLSSFDSVIARGLSGVDVHVAFRIVTARFTVKHVRGVAHVIEQIEGRPKFVGALQDVTESMVAEEALSMARSQLAHVARVATLSALTASIAHEVNQPLSGIITNAGTCLRMLDADPANVGGARETARRTIRDCKRAADVIARLRALFSKKEFSLESFDLNEATREVIALSLSELQRNRVVLRSELADDLPGITGDRIQLQQVMLNLLRNASDAMVDVHERPRQLLIRSERQNGDHVRLSVRDAGVGLDHQGMDKLFDAFYTTKSDGMGIGLSISRSIIERHNGRLWAEPNDDGPGATFSFSIPRDPENVTDAVRVMPLLPSRHGE